MMRFRQAPMNDAQLRAVVALQRGMPTYDGSLEGIDAARFEVLEGDAHRYDAIIVDDGLPLVVFARASANALAWWSDQDDDTESFPDADAVYAAFEQRGGV